MAVKRSEQLVVEFPPCSYILEGDSWVPRAGLDGRISNYTVVDFGASPYKGFVLESSIDLGGLFESDDTILIPQMYVTQDPGYYQAKTGDDAYTNSQGLMNVIEIISTRKLDMSTVFSDLFNTSTLPGQPLSIYDKQQIIVGELRAMMPNLPVYDPNTLALNNSPGFSVLNRMSTFGYAEKIANPRVFAYRMILPLLDGDGDLFLAPSLRMRLEVLVDKVSDAEYIFALKRNIELDQ